MRMLLLGPPGGGKGTQGARLSEHFGVKHVAAGDFLRAEVASGSDLGTRVAAYLRQGELVPDELILEGLTPTLIAAVARGGFILDGFPRTLGQAHAAQSFGRRLDIPLHAVVHLDVREEELQRRLIARAMVEGRSDDTPEVIARRLRVYVEETAPLIEFYRERRILIEVDGEQPVEEITLEVLARLGHVTPRLKSEPASWASTITRGPEPAAQ